MKKQRKFSKSRPTTPSKPLPTKPKSRPLPKRSTFKPNRKLPPKPSKVVLDKVPPSSSPPTQKIPNSSNMFTTKNVVSPEPELSTKSSTPIEKSQSEYIPEDSENDNEITINEYGIYESSQEDKIIEEEEIEEIEEIEPEELIIKVVGLNPEKPVTHPINYSPPKSCNQTQHQNQNEMLSTISTSQEPDNPVDSSNLDQSEEEEEEGETDILTTTSIGEFIDRPRSLPTGIKENMDIATHQDRPFDDTTSDEESVFLEKYREQIEAETLRIEKLKEEEEELIIKKVEEMFCKEEEEEEEDVILENKNISNPEISNMNKNFENTKLKSEEEIKKSVEEQKELERMESQKNYLFDEFIKTEEEYVSHLHELSNYYINPLLENLSNSEEHKNTQIISLEKHKEIFNLFQTIVPINILFLEEIKASRSSKNERNYDLFFNGVIKFSPCFKLYVQYINKFDTINLAMLEEEKKNSKFRIFCRNVSQTMIKKGFRINNLESFLILPVQRIPRYRLLLRNMLELETKTQESSNSNASRDTQQEIPNTKENNENDSSNTTTTSTTSQVPRGSRIRLALLENAFNSISRLTEYCNEERKRVSRALRMKELSEFLDIKELIQPHRQLIAEENDLKVTVRSKILERTKCSIYLFSDLFVVLVYHPVNYFVQQFTSENNNLQTIAIALNSSVSVKHEKGYLEEYVFSVSTNYYKRRKELPTALNSKKKSKKSKRMEMEDLHVEIFCSKGLDIMEKLIQAISKQTMKNRVSRRITVLPRKEKKKKKRKLFNLSNSRGFGEDYDLLSSIMADELNDLDDD